MRTKDDALIDEVEERLLGNDKFLPQGARVSILVDEVLKPGDRGTVMYDFHPGKSSLRIKMDRDQFIWYLNRWQVTRVPDDR